MRKFKYAYFPSTGNRIEEHSVKELKRLLKDIQEVTPQLWGISLRSSILSYLKVYKISLAVSKSAYSV